MNLMSPTLQKIVRAGPSRFKLFENESIPYEEMLASEFSGPIPPRSAAGRSPKRAWRRPRRCCRCPRVLPAAFLYRLFRRLERLPAVEEREFVVFGQFRQHRILKLRQQSRDRL